MWCANMDIPIVCAKTFCRWEKAGSKLVTNSHALFQFQNVIYWYIVIRRNKCICVHESRRRVISQDVSTFLVDAQHYSQDCGQSIRNVAYWEHVFVVMKYCASMYKLVVVLLFSVWWRRMFFRVLVSRGTLYCIENSRFLDTVKWWKE